MAYKYLTVVHVLLCILKFCTIYIPSMHIAGKVLYILSEFVLVIAWIAVKFGINTTSVALKIGKISQRKAK